MRYRNVTSLAAFLAILGCTAAMAVERAGGGSRLRGAQNLRLGQRSRPAQADRRRGDRLARRRRRSVEALEIRLAAVLKTGAPRDAKDYVCRKLMVIGTAASVPALAGLLADKDLSHMARYALERIPAPEAAQAMRDALPKLTGTLKIGVIGSLGARRDAASVPALAELLCDADATVAVAAAHAMGTIGTPEAAESLGRWLEKTPNGEKESVKKAVVEAGLVCADRCLESGQKTRCDSNLRGARWKGISPAGAASRPCEAAWRRADSAEKRMETAIQIIMNQDREMRAVGLEQVRDGLKGTEATQQFAALLPKLAPEAQVDLLAALAARGDAAARPAVLEMLKSQDSPVRTAAIQALGPLGEEADVPALSQLVATAAGPEKAAALTSLYDLRGQGINAAIVDQWQRVKPAGPRGTHRRAAGPPREEQRPQLAGGRPGRRCPSAHGRDGRAGGIGRPRTSDRHAQGRVEGRAGAGTRGGRKGRDVHLQSEGGRRPTGGDAVGRLGQVRSRRPDDPAAGAGARRRPRGDEGRRGGAGRQGFATPRPRRSSVVQLARRFGRRQAVGYGSARRRCRPPSGGVAGVDSHCRLARQTFGRQEAGSAEDRMDAGHARRRAESGDPGAQAVRTIESLRFVVAYLDQPAYAQEACATVVALARHRELREPNKAEFDKALDIVIRIGKNASVVDRAKRYRKGQT